MNRFFGRLSHGLFVVLGIVLIPVAFSCTTAREDRKKLDLGVKPAPLSDSDSPSFRDTVGSFCYLEGMASLPVRGYGLVVGLGKNGSTGCPKPIRERLVESLYKQQKASGGAVGGAERITPEKLIDSPDTAVVVVRGEVPPAAVEGTTFDVYVTALPGTSTRSLRGGRLYTTDLEVFRESSTGASISGQVVARAVGPVFLNPFGSGEGATSVTSLEGTVVGGGRCIDRRRIRLALSQPSYPWAQKIQDRINQRFPDSTRAADAISPSYIELRLPGSFRQSSGHFLSLVRAVYLSCDPAFEQTRARELAREMLNPKADHARIALCFESIGRGVLPVLTELYADPQESVSFHAAVAGLRLGDHVACDVMSVHATRVDGPYRFQAIRALGEAEGMSGAATTLRQLLHDDDPRVQVAAYEALLVRHDGTIDSKPIAGDNFLFDRVTSDRGNFIYIKRYERRRIALFGSSIQCTPPIHYRSPDGGLTITAQPSDETLTLLRTVIASGASSPAVKCSLDAGALIELLGRDADVDIDGNVIGLGLDFGAVVHALYHLCRDDSINAKFVLEQPNAAELFGPARTPGRPESELER